MSRWDRFADRAEAGKELAKQLAAYTGGRDVLALGIARGGVPVAFEVARTLRVPLDVLVVRKLGLPDQPELAIGAITSGGIRILNQRIISELGIPPSVIEAVTRREDQELERREIAFGNKHRALDPRGRVVILIDDGLATGATMRAAIAAMRERHAARVVVAVPVAPAVVAASIGQLVDEFVCPTVSSHLFAVGQFYRNFSPTTDDEVQHLLTQAAAASREAA